MKLETRQVLEGNVQISSLPSIFYQLSEAVEDPDTSFAEIGQIISGDPGLSARLLKIVNSAYYGFSSRIETITHAVTVVGMMQLRDLVLATVIIGQFKGISQTDIEMKSFWLHSIASGLAARVIAIYRKEPNPERFYVIGLMHDIGRLLLFLNTPDEMKEAMEHYRKGGLLYEAEQEVLGLDHAEIGGALLENWRLPPRLVESVKYHHRPSSAKNYPLDAAIAHVADVIAHALELGGSGERYVPPLDPAAWDILELPSSILSSVLAQVDRQTADAVEMFV